MSTSIEDWQELNRHWTGGQMVKFRYRFLVGLLLIIGAVLIVKTLTSRPDGLPAAESVWLNNFAVAKVNAKNKGKDVLIFFTGSDWCDWCLRLKIEVFDSETFKKEAPKRFVLVEVDIPLSKNLPEKIEQENHRLVQEFSINTFPTVVLLDSNGREYARTGYKAGGAENYLEHLRTLAARK